MPYDGYAKTTLGDIIEVWRDSRRIFVYWLYYSLYMPIFGLFFLYWDLYIGGGKERIFLKGNLHQVRKEQQFPLFSVLKNSYREALGLPLVEITADTEIFTEMGSVVKQENLQKKGICA